MIKIFFFKCLFLSFVLKSTFEPSHFLAKGLKYLVPPQKVTHPFKMQRGDRETSVYRSLRERPKQSGLSLLFCVFCNKCPILECPAKHGRVLSRTRDVPQVSVASRESGHLGCSFWGLATSLPNPFTPPPGQDTSQGRGVGSESVPQP